MKRLEQHQRGLRSNIYKYLIESEGDLAEAIGEVILDLQLSLDNRTYGLDDVPSELPYVALIAPNYEHSRMDLAFVSMPDLLGEDTQEGSLAEMRSKLYNVAKMQPWLDRLTDAAGNNDTSVEFRDLDDDPNPENQYALNNSQADWLRNRGYKVVWEKYPRSWIVSGWI